MRAGGTLVANRGVANSLCAKLRNAKSAAGRDAALKAFVNEVRAQSGKHVPADKASLLVSLAAGL